MQNLNIKEWLQQGEKEFEELKKQCAGHYDVSLPPEVLSWHSSRQISLIKMIENEISKSKKSTPLGLNPDEWEEVEAFNSVYNQALDTITSKLTELIK